MTARDQLVTTLESAVDAGHDVAAVFKRARREVSLVQRLAIAAALGEHGLTAAATYADLEALPEGALERLHAIGTTPDSDDVQALACRHLGALERRLRAGDLGAVQELLAIALDRGAP